MRVYVVVTYDGKTECIDTVWSTYPKAHNRHTTLTQELSGLFGVAVLPMTVDQFEPFTLGEVLKVHSIRFERLEKMRGN